MIEPEKLYELKKKHGSIFSVDLKNQQVIFIEIKQNINGIESTNITLQLIDPEEELAKQKQSAARHNLSKKVGEADYQDPIAQKLWGMQ
jgi:hypothetical protein